MIKKSSFWLLIILLFSQIIFCENNKILKKYIKVDKILRSYYYHITPSFVRNKKYPLVIVLHGGGGTGLRIMKTTDFNTLSTYEKFIVVYPNAYKKNWNDGRNVSYISSQYNNIDDIKFISKIIDIFIKDHNIDPKKVYLTGISNGAMMAFRYAIEKTRKISAIACVSGSIPYNLRNLEPKGKLPVLIINGFNDKLIPWNGGEIRFIFRDRGKVISVRKTAKYWVKYNLCSQKLVETEINSKFDDGTKVIKEIYKDKNRNNDVVLYKIIGGGHSWPGTKKYLPELFFGKTSKKINATKVIWKFFKEK